MNYDDFFGRAFGRESDKGFRPFDYQQRLARKANARRDRGCS
jgi:hypothetical protein